MGGGGGGSTAYSISEPQPVYLWGGQPDGVARQWIIGDNLSVIVDLDPADPWSVRNIQLVYTTLWGSFLAAMDAAAAPQPLYASQVRTALRNAMARGSGGLEPGYTLVTLEAAAAPDHNATWIANKYLYEESLSRRKHIAEGDDFSPFADGYSQYKDPRSGRYNLTRALSEALDGRTPFDRELQQDIATGRRVWDSAQSKMVDEVHTGWRSRGVEMQDAEGGTNSLVGHATAISQLLAKTQDADTIDEVGGFNNKALGHVADLIADGLFATTEYEMTGVGELLNRLIHQALYDVVDNMPVMGAAANVEVDARAVKARAEAKLTADAFATNADAEAKLVIGNAASYSGINAGTQLDDVLDPDRPTDMSKDITDAAQIQASLRGSAEFEVIAGQLMDSAYDIGELLNSAQTAALASIDSNTLDDIVDSFNTSQLPEHQRTVARMSATMVDINAVNGLAFMLGLSNLEAQRLRNLSEFRGKLELELYTRAYDAYIQTFRQVLEVRMRDVLERMQQRIASYTAILGEQAKAFLTGFTANIEGYLRMYTGYHEASRIGYSGYMEGAANTLGQQMDVLKAFYSADVQSAVGAKMQRLESRDRFVLSDVQQMEDMLLKSWALQAGVIGQGVDLNLRRIDAVNKKLTNQAEMEASSKMWKFDLIGKAMNYLGVTVGTSTQSRSSSWNFNLDPAGTAMGAKAVGNLGTALGL